jgi:hypothetical protein
MSARERKRLKLFELPTGPDQQYSLRRRRSQSAALFAVFSLHTSAFCGVSTRHLQVLTVRAAALSLATMYVRLIHTTRTPKEEVGGGSRIEDGGNTDMAGVVQGATTLAVLQGKLLKADYHGSVLTGTDRLTFCSWRRFCAFCLQFVGEAGVNKF